MYSWGCGYFGALAHGSEESFFVPKKVEFFQGKKIVQLSGGGFHAAALLGLFNILFSN